MNIILHAHSNWSNDGRITLEEWPIILKNYNLDGVCLTEHEESDWNINKYMKYKEQCKKISESSGKLIIPGIEFNCDGIHTLCYGLESFPLRPSSIEELKKEIEKQNRILVYAHPVKYNYNNIKNYMDNIDGIEIWNSKKIYDYIFGPNKNSIGLLNDDLIAFAGQDIHKMSDLTKLYINTKTKDILYDIKNGRFDIKYNKRIIDVNKNYINSTILKIYTKIIKYII